MFCQCVCVLQQTMWLTACGCNECQRSAGHCPTKQAGRQAGRQAGILTDNKEGKKAGGQAGRQTDRQEGRQTNTQKGREAGRQASRQTDQQPKRKGKKQAGKQTIGRPTGRQAGRQAGSQTGRQAGRRPAARKCIQTRQPAPITPIKSSLPPAHSVATLLVVRGAFCTSHTSQVFCGQHIRNQSQPGLEFRPEPEP